MLLFYHIPGGQAHNDKRLDEANKTYIGVIAYGNAYRKIVAKESWICLIDFIIFCQCRGF